MFIPRAARNSDLLIRVSTSPEQPSTTSRHHYATHLCPSGEPMPLITHFQLATSDVILLLGGFATTQQTVCRTRHPPNLPVFFSYLLLFPNGRLITRSITRQYEASFLSPLKCHFRAEASDDMMTLGSAFRMGMT